VELVSTQGKFLGCGYISKQNKGLGWLVSKQKVDFDRDFFISLFEKAKEKRRFYRLAEDITAYRLFNQEGDGFAGLTVDQYGDYALFSWYNPFVFSLKEEILQAFQEVFPELMGAYEKIRFKGLDYELCRKTYLTSFCQWPNHQQDWPEPHADLEKSQS